MAAAEEVVRARVDAAVKKEAAVIFERMGITMSGAIRMLLTQVVAEQALPFEVRVPNATTREAIAASRTGDVAGFATVDKLFTDLNDDED